MGFRRVFDYQPGRIGWVVRGLPTEGQLVDGKVGPIAGHDGRGSAPTPPSPRPGRRWATTTGAWS